MRTVLLAVTAFALSGSLSLAEEQKRDIRGVRLGMTAMEALEVLGPDCRLQKDGIVCEKSEVDGSEFYVLLTQAIQPQVVWVVSYNFQTTQSDDEVARSVEEAYGVRLNVAGCQVGQMTVSDNLNVELRPVTCSSIPNIWYLSLMDRTIQAADLELKRQADFKPVPKF